MKLSELLATIDDVVIEDDCVITGLALDHRDVKPGDLFIAYRGHNFDARDFIQAAIAQGARAILCEGSLPLTHSTIPIIFSAHVKENIGTIAATFYGYPADKMQLIGITGTNGKTSCSQLIANALNACGMVCGVIGTIGAGLTGKLTPLKNTTPDAVTLQRHLYELEQQGAQVVVMEVSSHSLAQGHRTQGLNYNIAVFTNLTRDHLDYHGDMEHYAAAKKLLFQQAALQYAVINYDDAFGKSLVQELAPKLAVYAYTLQPSQVATIRAEAIKLTLQGIRAKVTTPWGEGLLQSKLLGRFNVSNLLAVVTVLGILGIDLTTILKVVSNLPGVPGRMQALGGKKKPLVVIDYAHTPDALEQALLALREHCRGALWCVFGCGGDRDRGKRFMMGQIAERYSDHVVITNDNPRTEDQQQIVNDILTGIICPWAVEIEYERKVAIKHAIDCAVEHDIVLIAGKGHEDYQIIGTEKVPFSDIDVVTEALNPSF